MNAWDQFPGESDRAFRLFQSWLLEGRGRDPRGESADFALRYGWDSRAAAWDAHLLDVRTGLEVALLRDRYRIQSRALAAAARGQEIVCAALARQNPDLLEIPEIGKLQVATYRAVMTAEACARIPVPVSVDATDDGVDVSRLSDLERQTLAELMAKARG